MKTLQLRRFTHLRYGQSLEASMRREGDVPVYGSGGAVGTHNVPNTSAPVIIVGRKGSHGSVHWSDRPAFVIDTAFAIDGYTRPTDARWMYYVLLSAHLPRLSRDVGVPGLPRESVHELRVQNIEVDVQHAIADFLDSECERIARLDQRLQRLLDLAAERYEGQIDALFAPGPGQIKTKLRRLLRQRPRYGVLVPRLGDVGVPFVRVGDLDSLHLKDGSAFVRIPQEQSDEYRRTVVDSGDLLISVVGSIDKAVAVPVGLAGANIARAVARVCPTPGFPVSVLRAWTRSGHYRSQARMATDGDTAQPTLNMKDLAAFDVYVPKAEGGIQDLIPRIDQAQYEFEDLTRLSLQLRTRLAEYRDALITEAVTGQLDVTAVSEQQMDERLHEATERTGA